MSGSDIVLGIDIGTSGTKVIAVAENGSIVATATENYELLSKAVGWAEQYPEDWWNATVKATRIVLAKANNSSVAAISFSGQMHGLVPIDSEGKVIRPAIIWCDLRSVEQAERLEKEIGSETIIEWTQNLPLPNFTITKLLWMRDNEPDLYRRITMVLLPKDYVRYKMTGSFAMDISDASGTLMLDVAHRTWSTEICNAVGIPLNWLPSICESNDIVGYLSKEAGFILGLPSGVPIVAGAGDQAAGALGMGVIEPNDVSSVLGTSGVVLGVTDKPQRDTMGRLHTFCHAQRNRWFVMGVTQAAGGSLQWYRRRFAHAEERIAHRTGLDIYDLLLKQAEKVVPGAEGLLFLPYLMGERTPHLDPNARGAWLGLQWRHEQSHLLRSLLEGVSFSLRDCWSIIHGMGITTNSWKVSGGGSNSKLWMEILASILHHPLEIVQSSHGPAYGAAILAAQGTGILKENPESVRAWIPPGTFVEPCSEWENFYDKLYPLYKKAYKSSRDLSWALNQL